VGVVCAGSMSIGLVEGAAAYAEQKKVFQLFESLLQELIIHKPDKPIDHLIKVLKRPPVPRVVVSGPPGADARALCEVLAAKTTPNLVHVIASDVWRELARLNSPEGLKAKALVEEGKEVPSEMLLEMLHEKLTQGPCVQRGWILEGFPTNASETRMMLAKGLLPTRFLHIKVDDSECARRLTGRRIDPQSNTIYHIQDAPPPADVADSLIHRDADKKDEVTKRLLMYRNSMASVLPSFSKLLVELDGSQPGEVGVAALRDAALPTITSDMPTRAPRGCPRVMLMGGPGSNVEGLGAALAEQYGAKHISTIELLHGAALAGGKAAMKAMQSPQPLARAGQQVLWELVQARISQEDVRTAGFVLTGFPTEAMFIGKMKKSAFGWVRHAVHLQLEPKAAEAIVLGTRYDPVDGEIYHLVTNPPTDDDTRARLVTHPKDEPVAFAADMKLWKEALGVLSKAYKEELLVEDATRPQAQLVERLAPCFLSL